MSLSRLRTWNDQHALAHAERAEATATAGQAESQHLERAFAGAQATIERLTHGQ